MCEYNLETEHFMILVSGHSNYKIRNKIIKTENLKEKKYPKKTLKEIYDYYNKYSDKIDLRYSNNIYRSFPLLHAYICNNIRLWKFLIKHGANVPEFIEDFKEYSINKRLEVIHARYKKETVINDLISFATKNTELKDLL